MLGQLLYYTYEADIHCKECYCKRFGETLEPVDREGNRVYPVYEIDETPADIHPDDGGYSVSCGDCHKLLKKNLYENEG